MRPTRARSALCSTALAALTAGSSCTPARTHPTPAPTSARGSPAAESAKPAVVAPEAPRPIALPGGAPGIGFDDLRFAPGIDRVLVPAGRSGALDLIDPSTWAVTSIGGFRKSSSFDGGHDFGVTSADEGPGVIFATDRSSRELVVIDSAQGKIVMRTALGAGPDYVRWVAATSEVWVTEPDAEVIEVFAFSNPRATKKASISVPGGPESLIVDAASSRAYTNLWKGRTVAIDVKSRLVGPAWPNGCTGSRGIDVDVKHGWVFAGCAEGGISLLDAHTGAILSHVSTGAGVDIIAYDAERARVYAPGSRAATLTIAEARDGKLSLVRSVPIVEGSHCVASAGKGRVVVCDPKAGRVIAVDDTQ